nr:ABC transporter ATP-binding protein [Bacteroidota bacterium]
MRTIISTDKLSKIYQHRDGIVNALQDISLSINQGDFVTITGPSGSGKSTLLMALCGLIKPSGGTICFFDKDLTRASDQELSRFRQDHVGFIMQNFSLIPYMTALQNTMFPLILNGYEKQDQINRAISALKVVGLNNRLNHFPRELSAGQQQRVAIARAMVNKPSLIFADEPTGNLDPALAFDILNILKSINQVEAITIIIVTHSMDAAEYGNVKIRLNDGTVVNIESVL